MRRHSGASRSAREDGSGRRENRKTVVTRVGSSSGGFGSVEKRVAVAGGGGGGRLVKVVLLTACVGESSERLLLVLELVEHVSAAAQFALGHWTADIGTGTPGQALQTRFEVCDAGLKGDKRFLGLNSAVVGGGDLVAGDMIFTAVEEGANLTSGDLHLTEFVQPALGGVQ